MTKSRTSIEVSRLLYTSLCPKPLWVRHWHWQQCRCPSKLQWFLGWCGSLVAIPNRPQLIQGFLGTGSEFSIFHLLGLTWIPLSQTAGLPQGCCLPPHLPKSIYPLYISSFLSSIWKSLQLCPSPFPFFCCRMQAIISGEKMLVTLGYTLFFSLYKGPSSDLGSCRWFNQASSCLKAAGGKGGEGP